MYINIHIYIYIYIYMYVCIHACMYVYMHVCIYMQIANLRVRGISLSRGPKTARRREVVRTVWTWAHQ